MRTTTHISSVIHVRAFAQYAAHTKWRQSTTHSLRQIVGRKGISFFLLLARIVLLPFTNPTCVDINNNSNGIFRAWIAFCLESCSSRYSHRHRYRRSFATQAHATSAKNIFAFHERTFHRFCLTKKFVKNRCIRWARAHWVSSDYIDVRYS